MMKEEGKIFEFHEEHSPCLGVTVEMGISKDAHQKTHVLLDGSFWILGARREEFAEKLGKLVDEYLI